MLLKNKNKFSGFFRRLKFYIFGFLIGLVLVAVFFKDRAGCKMPGTLKVEELTSQIMFFQPEVICVLNCYNDDTTSIKSALRNGKVNYSKSVVRDKPYPGYVIEAYLKNGKLGSFYVRDQDTISLITKLTVDVDGSCECEERGAEGWN